MDNMKIKNIIDYTDKHTGEKYKKGSVREVPIRRGRELIKKGCAEAIKDEKKATGAPAAE